MPKCYLILRDPAYPFKERKSKLGHQMLFQTSITTSAPISKVQRKMRVITCTSARNRSSRKMAFSNSLSGHRPCWKSIEILSPYVSQEQIDNGQYLTIVVSDGGSTRK